MKRIRWTLALLALGIALPAVLIIQRAVASLELENVIQHEAVAERVFDEMERSLSDFLLREESRPASDYGALATADALPAAFASADEPFVLGWFALAPSGERHVFSRDPLSEPRVAAGLREGLLSRPASEPPTALPEFADEDLAEAELEVPAPGRTKSLGKDRVERRAYQAARGEKKETSESSAYEVLQSLNRAGSLRDERQTKAKRPSPTRAGRERAQAEEGSFFDSLGSGKLESLGYRGAELESDARDAEPPRPTRADEPGGDGGLAAFAGSGRSYAPEAAIAPAPPARRPAPRDDLQAAADPAESIADPIVDPLIGRSSVNGDVVLTRSVWRPDGVERQGLVLDRAALIAWLEERVLAETGLASVTTIDFGQPSTIAGTLPELAARPDSDHRYLHRFAEPFEALVARLDLAPLPGLGSARPIYALAGLLALVATIGLLAVDRMTRVVVDYATRRSDFVAAVSHELKTPLTSIRMYGEMLRDGLVASEDKREEYYSTITDESERLSRLIDNVLEFSRLEQNRRELSLVVGGLPEAIREASEKLRAHVDREGFRLSLDLEDDLPAVQYDRDAVTQLVFNLVDNAVKYARHAETREIEIKLRREDDRITLCVRDFGPGVPDDQLRRIFEPFYRIGEEMTRTTEGTGIGLALVKELSESMGALVSGRNAAGGGFEVRIAFAATS